jgi:tRNA threonylcarbamoyladenosine biosynthesis protein TsaB
VKLLAIDTATEACSVALSGIGDTILERFKIESRGHSNLVLHMVEDVLAEAGISRTDLDGIAYDNGPGSFTGIRIGLSVAQGFALAFDLPLLGVSSLMALAEGSRVNAVLPAIDARMGEVYWGRLAQDKESVEGWVWRDEARVSTPAAVPGLAADEIGVGSGWDGYSDAFGVSEINGQRWLRDRCPRASDIAQIACRCFDGGVQSSLQIVSPIYIRGAVT